MNKENEKMVAGLDTFTKGALLCVTVDSPLPPIWCISCVMSVLWIVSDIVNDCLSMAIVNYDTSLAHPILGLTNLGGS